MGESVLPGIMMRCVPAYPFNADYSVDVQGSRIEVARHLCRNHPGATKAIVLFFPGVHGGVGPCRTPGETFDADALFPTLAASVPAEHDIDCYRCSWPFMRPRMDYAISGACRVLHLALLEAFKD